MRFFVCMWLLLGVSAFAQNSDYLQTLLPSRVTMGMSAVDVAASQKHTFQSPTLDTKLDPATNYDLVERLGRGSVSWFYIRDGVLAGFMRTTKLAMLSSAEQEAERKRTLPGDDSGFQKVADEPALRMGTDLKSLVISVTKWKQQGGTLLLYTVSTNDEISAIVFNPSVMSRENFFLDPSRKSDVDANAEMIRKQREKDLRSKDGR